MSTPTKETTKRRTAFHVYPDTEKDIDVVVQHYQASEGNHVTMALLIRRFFKEEAERVRLLQQ